ncbi:DUF742 domain-containing protein [Saccharopolyspora rhizosphaerae]|uniref:DUF742 domain-containing protein n=1 Tax=Saccharopolyspora rhizosphaerae TaxID=2492662 RepID=A0A3R8P0B5_9PSEU|nr:DUF742 domain-containing protein [Saccharopolyspora rhizosphaerae]RRO13726.1 DUF742 domain-containing protein [Saccharopolyspora rhizosphaerae]
MKRAQRSLVRPHVVTRGRARPSRNTFEMDTQIYTIRVASPGAVGPEMRRVLEMCRDGAKSVAEIAGHLALPISVTKVLLGDLLDSGHIVTRTAQRDLEPPRLELLQGVLDGLRASL